MHMMGLVVGTSKFKSMRTLKKNIHKSVKSLLNKIKMQGEKLRTVERNKTALLLSVSQLYENVSTSIRLLG